VVRKWRSVAALMAMLTCITATAQSPFDSEAQSQWTITSECQMVVLPQKAALNLLPALMDDERIDTAFATIQKMIESGEAELAANLIARSGNDGEAVAESLEETKYGSHFDPPSVPDSTDPAVLKMWPIIGVTPTNFETRNVGTTFKADVSVRSEGRFVSMEFELRHVRFLKWTKIDVGKLSSGEHLFIEQPNFHTMHNSSAIMLRNGQRVLLGTHKIPDRPDKIELFLVRVEAKLVKPK
jgi:hypothetical protein